MSLRHRHFGKLHRSFAWSGVLLLVGVSVCQAEPSVQMTKETGKVRITIDGKPFADFVYEDPATTRPYLAHIKAPSGFQVTRNHPPVAGVDPIDHETLHPGIWLSFSELSGADFWRNKAPVKFERFLEEPTVSGGVGKLGARFRYESNGKTIAHEDLRLEFKKAKEGYWILWDSELSSDEPLVFSDQEEMGLGIRVATPLTVKEGGEITSSDGDKNEKGIRGTQATWCTYSKPVEGVPTGLFIVNCVKNESIYWHARDYGMLAANPFGQKSLTGKGDGTVTVKPPKKMQLRYGILAFSGKVDGERAAAEYLLRLLQDDHEKEKK